MPEDRGASGIAARLKAAGLDRVLGGAISFQSGCFFDGRFNQFFSTRLRHDHQYQIPLRLLLFRAKK
jgi:hypothetical protein